MSQPTLKTVERKTTVTRERVRQVIAEVAGNRSDAIKKKSNKTVKRGVNHKTD